MKKFTSLTSSPTLLLQRRELHTPALKRLNANGTNRLKNIVVRDKLKFTRLLDWLYCNQSKLQPR